MGLHNMGCNECGHAFVSGRLEKVVCPVCSSIDTKWFPSIMVGSTKKFWHPHLEHEPVEITSMRQLDKELEKRNLDIPEAPNKRLFKKPERPLPQTREEAIKYG